MKSYGISAIESGLHARRITDLKHFVAILSLAALLVFSGCSDADLPVTSSSADARNMSGVALKAASGNIGVNILLNTAVTEDILADLESYGEVGYILYKVKAVTMQAGTEHIAAIRNLPYVASVNPDAERYGKPVDLVEAIDFAGGWSTWDLDAINVTAEPFSSIRDVTYTGDDVYVAVLDTGLLFWWRRYFPQERIAVEYAKSFNGGPNETGLFPEQPNKWEHDQNSHGTHVTSSIIGYNYNGQAINGTAPLATVIPVKVLNQNGSGWSSVIARGIEYIADLKAGPLADHPVIINMSLGGPVLDPVEKAAMDYAIARGVIICASAGNRGLNGMGYPGGYEPVISSAASGWIYEWEPFPNGGWWRNSDVAEPTNPNDFYITDFSSRELAGQDLDIAAPGSWVVGPYQPNGAKMSYYYLGGTSQASPHTAGVVAMMAEKYPALTAAEAEDILESTAIPLGAGTRTIIGSNGVAIDVTWDTDATGAGLLDAVAALAKTP